MPMALWLLLGKANGLRTQTWPWQAWAEVPLGHLEPFGGWAPGTPVEDDACGA